MKPRMKTKFIEEVRPKVAEKFGLTNVMAYPRFDKIVINVGMGRELDGTKIKPHVRDQVVSDLTAISGQKPIIVKARRSVANFKVRAGYPTHAMVTLRGDRMWEFFDRLFTLAIPRVKDFRGLKDTSFDAAGNYSFGVSEQAIFPEINMAEAQYTHGFNINIVLRNSDPETSRYLLAEMGVPFVKREESAAA